MQVNDYRLSTPRTSNNAGRKTHFSYNYVYIYIFIF